MGRCIRLNIHTMEMPETTVSRYYPDKAELKQTLENDVHSYERNCSYTRSTGDL